jgi:serine/threonine-protein kinase
VDLPARVGRYEIVAPLAEGGMAEILLGRLTGPSGFEQVVVIKRILPHLARSLSLVEMFLDEARIVAGIRHANVVHVHELDREGDALFLVMEYLEGEAASALVRRAISRNRALPPWVGAHVVSEACAGLHAAHELCAADGAPLHLVHRDVSPQNIFVTYGGQTKVLDFGIAKARDRITRTEAGQLKGKLEYMAPEQCRGGQVDRRTDVFALGIVLHELTTARRLFRRAGGLSTMEAICLRPIVPPSACAENYPEELECIVMKALARPPDERYATAADMRRDLASVLRAIGPPAPDEALSEIMSELFADRIEQKRELLRRVRAGGALTHVPGEADVTVDIPIVTATRHATAADTMPESPSRGRRRIPRWVWPAGAIAGGGVAALSAILGHAPAPTVAERAEAPSIPSPSPPPRVAEPEASTVSPRQIAIWVISEPAGATVIFDGTERGPTPLELRALPRPGTARLELRKPGYVPLDQEVSLDVDQRLKLALTKVGFPSRPSPAPLQPAVPRPALPANQPVAPPAAKATATAGGFHKF